jgi:hypothetical protein
VRSLTAKRSGLESFSNCAACLFVIVVLKRLGRRVGMVLIMRVKIRRHSLSRSMRFGAVLTLCAVHHPQTFTIASSCPTRRRCA